MNPDAAKIKARGGFTLLEMLLAMAVSSVLMLAVLAVISGFGRVSNLTGEGSSDEKFSRQLRCFSSMLAGDIAAAESVDVASPNRVKLVGAVALGGADRSRSYRLAEVLYCFETISGRKWLVRRQRMLDVAHNRADSCDLVCCDIGGFNLIQTGGEQSELSGGLRWTLRSWPGSDSSASVETTLAAYAFSPTDEAVDE